jgi:hypothetical protein
LASAASSTFGMSSPDEPSSRSPAPVTIDLIGTKTQTDEPVDSVTVDLASNTITHETPPFDHPAIGEQETRHI